MALYAEARRAWKNYTQKKHKEKDEKQPLSSPSLVEYGAEDAEVSPAGQSVEQFAPKAAQ